jgi:hypothetical protein
MRHKGSKPCQVVTTVGMIQAGRPRWRCETCGADSYPHDAVLRFSGHAVSESLAKLTARLGALLPFDEARDMLAEHFGVRLSKQSIELVTVEAGQRLLELDVARPQAIEHDKAPSGGETLMPALVCVFADSGQVHIEGDWMTVRVATVASFDFDGKLLARTTLARILPVDEFGELVAAAANRVGLDRAETRAFIADGSDWLWQIAEQHVREAVQILDWNYLADEVQRVARAVFRLQDEAAAWAKRQLDDIGDGKLDAAIGSVRAELSKRLPRARRRAVQELLGFLERNAGRVNYPRYRSLGIPVSGGADEPQAMTVVERRCRAPGMRNWKRRSAEALAALRAAIFDGSFDERWRDRQIPHSLPEDSPP